MAALAAAASARFTQLQNFASAQYEKAKTLSLRDLTAADCLKSVDGEGVLARVAKVVGRVLAAVATVALVVPAVIWAGVKLLPSAPAYLKNLLPVLRNP